MTQSGEIIVLPEWGGERLDRLLAGQLPQFSRSRLQGMIDAGDVSVNGVPSKPSYKVRGGERISWRELPAAPVVTQAEALPLTILFEDESLIVLDKPAGMVVHPGAGNQEHTLVNALLHHCGHLSGIGGEQRPGIVHRLDKETSGCLAVAKDDIAHRKLSEQFARREVKKLYLAVVHGIFKEGTQVVELAVMRHPVDRKKMMATASAKGRAARTEFAALWCGACTSLVQCQPSTGRTHQIRVHLHSLGNPIIGDKVYGKSREPSAERHLLHAWKLAFEHPKSGEELRFAARLPSDFYLPELELYLKSNSYFQE